MFERGPKERIETGEMPAVGQIRQNTPEKGWAAGRNLTIFKSFVLAVLVAITFYGMLNRGIFSAELWLPVAMAILSLAFITLFITDYFAGTPRIAWVLLGLLMVLVGIKGFSLAWSIARTETVQEL